MPDRYSKSRHLLKKPTQARSRNTVATLLEGTELVLVEEGWERLTTNRVAERAGVSIGTLYQYFANKEALVGLLIDDYIEEQFELLVDRLSDTVTLDMTLDDAVPHIIKAMLAAKMVRPDLSRALFEQMPSFGASELLDVWNRRAIPIVEMTLQARASEVRPMNFELVAYILNNALHGIVHATVLSRPELLDQDEFSTEICELVMRYLRAER